MINHPMAQHFEMGFAIVLMVIYHFIYDMRVFDVILVNKDLALFWVQFPKFIVLLFCISNINSSGSKHLLICRFFVRNAFGLDLYIIFGGVEVRTL